jgi:hypothetical protein
MYKFLLLVLVSSLAVLLFALQSDEEMAMQVLFQSKHALNRATHAAAQSLDERKLAAGIYSIDPVEAKRTAELYLRENLGLDAHGFPLPGSPLQKPVDMLEFAVIDEHRSFPYVYRNETYDFEVVFRRPGVVMIIGVAYPRIYNVLQPIYWHIKSASELVF